MRRTNDGGGSPRSERRLLCSDSNLSLGAILNPGLRALNLPAGNNGAAARSGVELSWSGNRVLQNATGNDLVIYESGTVTAGAAVPEAFMIQVRNGVSGAWSSWYYTPATASASTNGGEGMFATTYDLSNFGIGAAGFIDRIRLVNMTDEDRMASASGIGAVLPEDNGATSAFVPLPGALASFPAYGSATFDPDPVYVGAFNALINPLVDVSVTKTDGQTSVTAGQPVTYTIVVSNVGPNAANGTTLADTLPAGLTGVTFTSTASGGATGNTAAGAGNLNETLNLPAGSSVTYLVTGTASPAAAGTTLSNTATATVVGTLTDSNAANNSATDTTAVVGLVDVSVTKTDGQTQAVTGTALTYTIVVSNNGLNAANGTTFTDNLPANLVGVTYTSTAAGGATGNTSGAGSISNTLNLPAGSSVTYLVTGTVNPVASGTLSNTATATVAGGLSDANAGNNSATDNTTIIPLVDVAVTKTDGQTSVPAGATMTYTIVVSNVGPNAANGTTFTDTLPAGLTGVTFTSTASGGATGNTAAGAGNLNETLNLPAGSSVTYLVTGTASPAAGGTLSNTATATVAGTVSDSNTANNSATDTTAVLVPVPPSDTPAVTVPVRLFAVGADAARTGT